MHTTLKKLVTNLPIEKLPPIYQHEIRERFVPNEEWIYEGQFFSLIEDLTTGKKQWYASFKQRGNTKLPTLTIDIPTPCKETPKGILRLWNGRGGLFPGRTKDKHINIAARTKKDAAVLLVQAYEIQYDDKIFGKMWMEIHKFFAETWGNDMEGTSNDQPGVWLTGGENGPEKIV